MGKELSVLILSIFGREAQLESLMTNLLQQIREHDLSERVEILVSKDERGQNSIGEKRNGLLANCSGEYAAFIDDDDSVSEDYLPVIINAISTKPDVVSLEGIYIVDGFNPKKFVHSNKYVDWFESDGVYYRPPNHLNVIKTSISKQFQFPPVNHGEDRDWSIRISKAMVLRTEAEITKAIYFYNYSSIKPQP